MIDLGACERLLKDENDIDPDINLIFLKFEKLTNKASEKNVQYEVYNPINNKQLNLSICMNTSIDLYIPITLTEKAQNLYEDLKKSGYDLFNEKDSFYTDICTPYKSDKGTDVLLSDRKNDYYNTSEITCQSNCNYSNYYFDSKYLKCECSVGDQHIIDTIEPEKFNGKMIFKSFYDVLKYSNLKILKCYKLVFDEFSITKNIGSILTIIYYLIYMIFFITYNIKDISSLKIKICNLFSEEIKNINSYKKSDKKITKKISDNNFFRNSKKIDKKTIIIHNKKRNKTVKSKKISIPPKKKVNPFKSKNNEQNNHTIIRNKKKNTSHFVKHNPKGLTNRKKIISSTLIKTDSSKNEFIKFQNLNYKNNGKEVFMDIKEKEEENIKEKEQLSNFELNNLEYYEALKLDKRSFNQIYWSILMRDHRIIFTFFSWNDYNISYVKYARFIFLVTTDMAMNVLFFTDESMHKLYLNYGKYNFIQQINQIIYSTIISQLLELFLCYLCYTDKHFYQIKALKINKMNKDKIFQILKCIKSKLIVFFIFTTIMFGFYWYLIAAFCAVYRNTQMAFIKDSALSFLTGLIYPIVLYLFPAGLRIISLKDVEKRRYKCIYKLSNIIPMF